MSFHGITVGAWVKPIENPRMQGLVTAVNNQQISVQWSLGAIPSIHYAHNLILSNTQVVTPPTPSVMAVGTIVARRTAPGSPIGQIISVGGFGGTVQVRLNNGINQHFNPSELVIAADPRRAEGPAVGIHPTSNVMAVGTIVAMRTAPGTPIGQIISIGGFAGTIQVRLNNGTNRIFNPSDLIAIDPTRGPVPSPFTVPRPLPGPGHVPGPVPSVMAVGTIVARRTSPGSPIGQIIRIGGFGGTVQVRLNNGTNQPFNLSELVIFDPTRADTRPVPGPPSGTLFANGTFVMYKGMQYRVFGYNPFTRKYTLDPNGGGGGGGLMVEAHESFIYTPTMSEAGRLPRINTIIMFNPGHPNRGQYGVITVVTTDGQSCNITLEDGSVVTTRTELVQYVGDSRAPPPRPLPRPIPFSGHDPVRHGPTNADLGGIDLDRAPEVNLTDDQIDTWFTLLDQDESGSVDFDELTTFFTNFNIHPETGAPLNDDTSIEEILINADEDEDNVLNQQEFREFIRGSHVQLQNAISGWFSRGSSSVAPPVVAMGDRELNPGSVIKNGITFQRILHDFKQYEGRELSAEVGEEQAELLARPAIAACLAVHSFCRRIIHGNAGLRALEVISPGFRPGPDNLDRVLARFNGHLIQGVETDCRESRRPNRQLIQLKRIINHLMHNSSEGLQGQLMGRQLAFRTDSQEVSVPFSRLLYGICGLLDSFLTFGRRGIILHTSYVMRYIATAVEGYGWSFESILAQNDIRPKGGEMFIFSCGPGNTDRVVLALEPSIRGAFEEGFRADRILQRERPRESRPTPPPPPARPTLRFPVYAKRSGVTEAQFFKHIQTLGYWFNFYKETNHDDEKSLEGFKAFLVTIAISGGNGHGRYALIETPEVFLTNMSFAIYAAGTGTFDFDDYTSTEDKSNTSWVEEIVNDNSDIWKYEPEFNEGDTISFNGSRWTIGNINDQGYELVPLEGDGPIRVNRDRLVEDFRRTRNRTRRARPEGLANGTRRDAEGSRRDGRAESSRADGRAESSRSEGPADAGERGILEIMEQYDVSYEDARAIYNTRGGKFTRKRKKNKKNKKSRVK
jgi:hypothetical protein